MNKIPKPVKEGYELFLLFIESTEQEEKFSEREVTLLKLYFGEKRTVHEIARYSNRSYDHVSKQLNRVKRKLRNYIQQMIGRMHRLEDEIALAEEREQLLREKLSEKSEVLSKPLAEISFSARTQKVFKRLGVKTLKELSKVTPEELSNVPGCGRASMMEIEKELTEHGLSLG